MTSDTCLIDEFGPLPVVSPQSTAELGEVVKRAAVDKDALYPLGGRTTLRCGFPPTRPGFGVDLRGLAQVVDYPARDMTITVQAGITVARLQELLRTENQRLPIDVPLAEQATLGGALAANTSGCRRYGFGTPRDYVIGLSAINDRGEEAKAGGRVVKNVAGYDLCKLHVGAFGTLGIINQVTLKLKPLPEENAQVTLGCAAEDLESMLALAHRSRTRPVCIDVVNRAAARAIGSRAGVALPDAAWVLAIGYEDNRTAVGWQVQQLIKEIPVKQAVDLEARIGPTAASLWQALVEFPAPEGQTNGAAGGGTADEGRVSFKANLLPGAVADFCRRAEALAEHVQIQAHAGNGIVVGHVPGGLTLKAAQTLLQTLQDAAVAAQGNLVVRACPTAWKRALPVWGARRGDLALMRAVKTRLDPEGRFNPGRFLDGL